MKLALPGATHPPRRRRLWIFPPGHPPGWHGLGNSTCEVAVFHFPNVPDPLRQNFEDRAFLEIPLLAAQCRRLRLLAHHARIYLTNPSPGMLLFSEQILLELSLLALESIAERPPDEALSKPLEVSLRWYSENMSTVPSLEKVARAAGTSPAHLRRLFHRTFQKSPKQFFDELRFQRAMQLMADPSIKLESISEQCGFGSASAYSRAFRNKFGCSPTTWRTSVGT
jgi:AraC-like DNA-binding protein